MYSAAASCRLLAPSAFAPDVIKAASQLLLEEIYKPGFEYRKAGVFVTDIVPDAGKQANLLLNVDDQKQQAMMQAIDRINYKYGKRGFICLRLGIYGRRKLSRTVAVTLFGLAV
jgi:DNA polymerase V